MTTPESFTRRVLDNLFAFVGVLDLDGTVLEANRAPLDAAGIRPADVIGRKFWDCYWWSYSPEIQAQLREAVSRARQGETLRYDVPVRMAGDSRMWIDFQIAPLRDEQGEITHLIPSAMDITARREATEALRESENRLAAVLEQLPVGAGLMDGQGRWVMLNSQMASLMGDAIPSADPPNVARWQSWDAEGRPLPASEWPGARALRGETVNPGVDFLYTDASGAETWARVTAAPFRNPAEPHAGAVAIVQDITERKQAEEALRDREERLRLAVDAAALGTFDYDVTSDTIHWDDRACAIFGLDQATTSLGEFFGRIHPDDQAWVQGSVAALTPAEDQAQAGGEYRILRPDGRVRWIDAHIALTMAGQGTARRPVRIIGTVQDVTNRKLAERAVTDLVQRLNSLVDNTPLAVVEWDADFVITRWSGQAERLFGWTAGEVVGRRIDELELIYAEDIPRVEAVMGRLQDPANKFVVSHNRNNTRSGQIVTCEWYNSVLHDENGRLVAVLSLVLDVTEREQAAQALRESEERFRILADAMPQLVWTAQPDGTVDYYNARVQQFEGFAWDEHRGRWRWQPAVHPDDEELTVQAWNVALVSGQEYRVEHRIRLVDGSGGGYRWFLSRGVPVRNEAGAITKWYGTATDIQAIKEAEEALVEADRRKDEFLATLAHELRNPLAPIRNAVQLLNVKGAPTPEAQAARDTIDRQVQQLVRLIDDLLDVSRITYGRLELRQERVALAAVLDQALEMARPPCEAAGHSLVVSLPPEQVYVQADAVRLAQVFFNLLSNACKYTPRGGGIWLTALRGGDEVVVSVKDSGIGIPPEKLRSVFEMFSQVDRSLERTQGGLGIGLTIVKQLVEMHGGTIQAFSDGVDQGSEFVVRLPILVDALPAPDAAPRYHENGAAPRRVLIVDDNVEIVESMAELMELDGHEISTAHDGLAAVEAAERVRPDVILLDIGLPKLNGYDVCRRVRAEAWGKDMLIIALTGWGQAEDRRRSREAGFDYHLVKPVEYDDLLRLMTAPRPRGAAA